MTNLNTLMRIRAVFRELEEARVASLPKAEREKKRGIKVPENAVDVFIEVANADPEEVYKIDLQRKLRLSSASATRNAQYLSKWSEFKGEPGLDLCFHFQDVADKRRDKLTLTPKGRIYARQIDHIIKGGDRG